MIANWVKETTATVGTGTISLGGAGAGHIAFSSAFISGERVLYAIEDGSNREIGIGTLTSGSPWTLARTAVLETLVAGTYNNTAPAPITLSGTATVGVAAAAQSLVRQMLGAPAAARGIHIPPNVMRYDRTGAPGGEYTPFAGRICLVPMMLLTPTMITELGAEITTAQAGGNFRVGIYSALPSGAPGALLADSGNLSTAATGIITATLAAPLSLPAGRYYTANCADNIVVRARGVGTGVPGTSAGSGLWGGVYGGVSTAGASDLPYYNQAYGALPATWPGASGHQNFGSIGVLWR